MAKEAKFTFIDLFAGIGGMRLAFEKVGGECVFSSEWDKYSQKTYAENFGEVPHGDITQISEKDIPKFDVLLAGFPSDGGDQSQQLLLYRAFLHWHAASPPLGQSAPGAFPSWSAVRLHTLRGFHQAGW